MQFDKKTETFKLTAVELELIADQPIPEELIVSGISLAQVPEYLARAEHARELLGEMYAESADYPAGASKTERMNRCVREMGILREIISQLGAFAPSPVAGAEELLRSVAGS